MEVIKNCGEAYTGWNYNTEESDSFLHKSNQQTKSLPPSYKIWLVNDETKKVPTAR
jgi:hypothetical protein